MNYKNMIKKLASGILCISFVVMPAVGFSWEAGTHAYIEERLYKKQGQSDPVALYNRIYGATAIDIFNNNFTAPYIELHAYIHDITQDNFLKASDAAASRNEKAFAYGFVGHNNTWGMDSTAHISGVTFGRGEGYVIAKARMLVPGIKAMIASQAGLNLPDEIVLNLCHYLVESGVDLLVRTLDPAIGSKLMAAAYYRGEEVPALLVKAYSEDLSSMTENTAQFIAGAEGTFRASIMGYGWALTQDNALDLIAGGLAKTGAAYLGLPVEAANVLFPLAQQGILAAMDLCARDFEAEIKATTGWVNGRLSSHQISW